MDTSNSQDIHSLGDIQTEIVESVDDYFSNEKFISNQFRSNDETSLHGRELMPIVRHRSPSNNEAYKVDAHPIYEQKSPIISKKIVTSAHTPDANIIMNLGIKIRNNFRSFVNRRENLYTSNTDNDDLPLKQVRNRRSSTSNSDSFSVIPSETMNTKADEIPCEVYDGSQFYTDSYNQMSSLDKASSRSPSAGPMSYSLNSPTKKVPTRSRSEVRRKR